MKHYNPDNSRNQNLYGNTGAPALDPNAAQGTEGQIKVDGYEQVLAMLKIADDEFRESLLRRLGQRDRQLAASLRAHLAKMGIG